MPFCGILAESFLGEPGRVRARNSCFRTKLNRAFGQDSGGFFARHLLQLYIEFQAAFAIAYPIWRCPVHVTNLQKILKRRTGGL